MELSLGLAARQMQRLELKQVLRLQVKLVLEQVLEEALRLGLLDLKKVLTPV